MRVTVKNDKTPAVLKSLKAMKGAQVLIGVPSSADGRSGEAIGNAALAYINDRGAPSANIPARPFLVVGVEAGLEKATKALKVYAAKGLDNPEQIDKGLAAAGMICRDAVKARIVSQEGFKPLSPTTLKMRKARGFTGTKALIVTASLLNSITYVVERKK